MKTRAVLRVSASLLTTILIGLKADETPRAYHVVKNGLPNDVSLVQACLDPHSQDILLVLESEYFTIAADAQIHPSGYPYLEPPTFQVAYK